jgi:O-antigen/teichoic acid export membrane protein
MEQELSQSETLRLPFLSNAREQGEGSPWRRSFSLLLSGSLVMLFGSVAVSGLNFAYNVATARMLGPAEFSHATAATTLLMLCSALTLSFQLVCAKFVARNEEQAGKARVYRSLLKRAWIVSAILAGGLALFERPMSEYLRLPANHMLIVLAAGMAFYVPLGVRRGNLQGLCHFHSLSWNMVAEAATKLLFTVLLVGVGYGVMGAVGATTASVLAAFMLPAKAVKNDSGTCDYVPASFREGIQAIVFFVGQVVINNIDILLVKHYFSAEAAGMYAAVALVGRVIYFAAWSVISAMFPISAAAREEDNKLQVLLVPLGIVTLMCLAATFILWMFPDPIMGMIFGSRFQGEEALLTLFAINTGVYAISVVLMSYEMSRKIANTGWLQLVFSGGIMLMIAFLHSSLEQVVVLQIGMKLALLLFVSIPFLRNFRAPARLQEAA